MTGKQPDLKSIIGKAAVYIKRSRRFSVLGFIVFVALLYGFIFMRINNLNNVQPSDDSVTAQTQSTNVPRINKSVVRQLESLKDNSVNVQTLFNQARSNPFR